MIRVLASLGMVSLAVLACGRSAEAQSRPIEGRASTFTDIFATANLSASRGDFTTAIGRYNELIAAGVDDADVYFNLGTAYADLGDYPRAILSYERALNLRPGDDQAENNLRLAEQALEETRADAEGEASIQRSTSISDAIFAGVTENALAYAVLLSDFLLFAALAWAWLRRRRGRGFYTVLVTSSIVLAVSATGLAVKAGFVREGPRAVVLDDRLELREGPDPRAEIRGEARGGDRAVVLRRDQDFVKLRVMGGTEGWASGTGVGLIDRD